MIFISAVQLFSLNAFHGLQLKRLPYSFRKFTNDWNEYFGDLEKLELHFWTNITWTGSDSNYLLTKCYFHQTTSTLGGAILITSSKCTVLLEKTTFEQCTANIGGCMYLNLKNFICTMVCAFQCGTTSIQNNFMLCQTSDVYNMIEMTTTNNCSSQSSRECTYLSQGNCTLKNFNCSFNTNYQRESCLSLSNPMDHYTLHECTFYNNSCEKQIIYFDLSTSISYIFHNNFIENSKTEPADGFIYFYSNTTLRNCVFMYNSVQGIYLKTSSYVLLDDCYSKDILTTDGDFDTYLLDKEQKSYIVHLNTALCPGNILTTHKKLPINIVYNRNFFHLNY